MEFHGLPRKELQALCKRNKIPANMTNVAMADALAALPHVEGLGEIMNPKEGGDIGTPAVQPRTAGRATTQRKPVKESESLKISTRPNRGARSGVAEGEVEQENKNANVPVTTPAVVPCTRRRGPAVSTRGKKEVIILDDDEEEDDKNEVDEKPKDVPAKTPAVAPKSRTRAAGRSVRDKKEISDGTSLQNAYSTRRSVRVLGKSLSKVSLVETEVVEQTKSEDVSEDAATSLQTESNVGSQNNDEVEVSSVNKAESETKSHDSGSEAKSADAEDVLQAEPEVEGTENVNHVEAHENLSLNLEDSFETCVDSKQAESEQPELEESGNADGTENKESFGAKQVQTMEFAAPEETPLEVADQAIGDTAEIENKETFGAKQDQIKEFVAPEEAPLEVADQGIGASTDVVSGDISMEVANQEVAGLSVEASEEAFKVTAEQAAVGLSIEAYEEASKEICHQVIGSSTDLVSDDSKDVSHQEDVADLSVEASEEIPKGTAEQAFVGLSVESSEEASKEISHQAIASSIDAVFDDASKEVSAEVSEVAFKEIAELATTVGLSLESSEKASQESSHQAIALMDVVVVDDVCVDNLDEGVADMVFEEVENVEGAVSAILAEKDETSGRAEDEGEKESSDVEKVILKLSMMDVSSKKEADQNNTSQKLEVEAQAEELGTEGHTELEDESEKESNSVEKVTLKLSMMDVSAKKEADLNNTSQKLEVEENPTLKLSMMDVSAKKEALKLSMMDDSAKKEALKLSMMDVSAKKEADLNNTSQKLEVEENPTLKLSMMDVSAKLEVEENPELEAVVQTNVVQTNDQKTNESVAVEQIMEEPICSPQLETKEKLKTIQDMSVRRLRKLLKSGTREISNEIQAVTNVDSDMNNQVVKSGTQEISNEIQAVTSVDKQLLESGAKEISNEIQAVTSVESDVNNPNAKKENSKTIDVQNMSMRGLKKLLKEKLDGKLAMADNDDVQMQGVEKKRTALQALPQNQLAEQKAAY